MHQLEDHAFVQRASEGWSTGDPDPYRSFLALYTFHSRLWDQYLVELRDGTASPEAAIVFLEVDPWCTTSGYMKQKLMRYVSRYDLSVADRRRLQLVVIDVLCKGPRREFPVTALLAKRIWDTKFEEELTDLASSDPGVIKGVDLLLRKRYTR